MTRWRRLRDWNEVDVRKKLHELLLSELRAADLKDFSRAAVDSSHIRAMKGGPAASTMSSSTRTAPRWPRSPPASIC